MAESRHEHWTGVYARRREAEVGWFQETPARSLGFMLGKVPPGAAIIDVGGGASRLVDRLLDAGYRDLTVLDLAETALAQAKARLGERASQVTWIAADVTEWTPPRRYDLWHDRAVLHFLTSAGDRAAYRAALAAAVVPGGLAVIATFAPSGPDRCSGLPVVRYSPESLAAELGPDFALVEARLETHRTPAGIAQDFQFSRFVRRAWKDDADQG